MNESLNSEALARLVYFYTSISKSSVGQISNLYDAQAYFKDPFNEVTGTLAIEKIFAHMFAQVSNPRFTVLTSFCGSGEHANEAFLTWLFYWKSDDLAKTKKVFAPIRGSSHIKFNSVGKVVFHRDYWDAAEELYETVPVLGSILRMIKRKLQAA